MADDKKSKGQWLGREIYHPSHTTDLEMRSAQNQFGRGMDQQSAEEYAHKSYLRDHALNMAAYALMHAKALPAIGNHADAEKYYNKYVEYIGKANEHAVEGAPKIDPMGPVHPEVQAHMGKHTQKYYSYQPHPEFDEEAPEKGEPSPEPKKD